MAKWVMVCLRRPPADQQRVNEGIAEFLNAICPDNLKPRPGVIMTDGLGAFLGVLNPTDRSCIHGVSAYAGWLSDAQRWWEPGTIAPDGTFALIRTSPDQVEAVADYAGSRTIWIARTDELFIASTSQRAIPWFLAGFEPNPQAMAWMLSSGSLGPGEGWDRRAQPLRPDGRATLDRHTWQLAVENPDVSFAVDPVPDTAHVSRLRDALHTTVGGFDLKEGKWVLPLSGGHDSRLLLLFLRSTQGLRCVTWGQRESLEVRGTDAHVACQLAHYVGAAHEYLLTDFGTEPVGKLIDRFIAAGEGRTDHLAGYVDGLEIWRGLFNRGVSGIIRGDHGFGPKPGPQPSSAREVHHYIGMTRWDDHEGLPSLDRLDLPHLQDQPLPTWYERRKGESLLYWRERLYQAFRIPTVLAALSDVKAPFCEIASPLLTRAILLLTRSAPEHLLRDKRLPREVLKERDVPIHYAHSPSTADISGLLQAPEFAGLLRDELNSQQLRATLSAKFADMLLSRLGTDCKAICSSSRRRGLIRRLKSLMPAAIGSAWHRKPSKKSATASRFALRGLIVARITKLFEADARRGTIMREWFRQAQSES